MADHEKGAPQIAVTPGEPPTLHLPWDESQMVHDSFRRWGVPRQIGDSFGDSRQEFLRRCRVAGITPGQATFGVELNMWTVPPGIIADSLAAYDAQQTELVLHAQPPYDVFSLDYIKAAIERKKVNDALQHFRELGLIPPPETREPPVESRLSSPDYATNKGKNWD